MNYLYNGNIKLIKREKTPCAVLIAEVLSDGHHIYNRNRKLIKCIQKTDGAVLMCSCKINDHGKNFITQIHSKVLCIGGELLEGNKFYRTY